MLRAETLSERRGTSWNLCNTGNTRIKSQTFILLLLFFKQIFPFFVSEYPFEIMFFRPFFGERPDRKNLCSYDLFWLSHEWIKIARQSKSEKFQLTRGVVLRCSGRCVRATCVQCRMLTNVGKFGAIIVYPCRHLAIPSY